MAKYIYDDAPYNGDGTTPDAATGSTVTITIASPGVVSWAGHGLAADTKVYLGTSGTLPTGLSANTDYYVRNPGTDTFELSATPGGASIDTSVTQSGTHTCATVGAWNDLTTIFENGAVYSASRGGAGSISAGDTIYIRCKDYGGASISRTTTTATTIGSSVGALGSRVTWVVDNGTVWSGVTGGTVTWTGNYAITLRSYNNFFSEADYALILRYTLATANNVNAFIVSSYVDCSRVLFDNSTDSSSSGSIVAVNNGCHFFNCHFMNFDRNSGYLNGGTQCSYTNPKIELLGADSSPVFSPNFNGGTMTLFGGRIYGAGATAATLFQSATYQGPLLMYGTDYPIDINAGTYPSSAGTVYGMGIGGESGGLIVSGWGFADSRDDGNYPKLNATLPDSTGTTKWAWRVYPDNVSEHYRVQIPFLKFYTQSYASKKITLEILLHSSWVGTPAPDKSNTWIDLVYVDHTTGYPVAQTTRDIAGGSLTSSSAGWTAEAWGLVPLAKYKFELTTDSTIKQDTMIQVVFNSFAVESSANDVFFICPDFLVETP